MNAGYSSSVYWTSEQTKPRRTEEDDISSLDQIAAAAAMKPMTSRVQVKDLKPNPNRTH